MSRWTLACAVAVGQLLGQQASRPRPAPAAQPVLAPAPSYKNLKFAPLRPVQLPAAERVTLANGMRLLLIEDRELPLVSGTAMVRTGSLFDSPTETGLARVAATVLRTGGSAGRSGEQIDAQLEALGATITTGMAADFGHISFSGLKGNLDELLAVFKDVVTAPEFRQDKVDLAKTQLRNEILRRSELPASIGVRRELAAQVYGSSAPHGRREEYATVARISRPDLRQFHERYFFPANILLAIRGDFAAAEMKAGIQRLFESWKAQAPPVSDFPKPGPAAPGIYVAVRKGLPQAEFGIGAPAGEWRDKDSPALEIAAAILGSAVSGRLYGALQPRLRDGFEVAASWEPEHGYPGLLLIAGRVKPYSLTETLRAIRDEVVKLRGAEIADEELRSAKDTALAKLAFRFDTPEKALDAVLRLEYFGYPGDFVQAYQKSLAAVMKADVARVAKQYLDPGRFVTVVMGNPADFGRSLSALGLPVTEIDTTSRQPARESAPSDTASIERGKQILAGVRQAAGGVEKLEAVRDFVQTLEFELSPAAGGGAVTQIDRWIAPLHIRQESQFPEGRVTAYWNGTAGRIATPRGSGPLAGSQLKQVQGDLFRMYFRLLLSDRIESRVVNAVDANTVEISNSEGEIATLVVDPASGLPARILYETVHASVPFPIPVEESIQEFQEIGGIKVPSRFIIFEGGQKFADVSVTAAKVNQGLKVEDLQRVQ